jgi:hypothetical protein
MSFGVSAGVYPRIVDQSFVVNAGGLVAGGIVVSAKKGPTTINTVTSAKEYIETYGLPSRDNPSLYAGLRFLNRAGILTVRRVINDATKAVGDLLDYGVVIGTETDPSTITPVLGDSYIIGSGAVGDWAGFDGKKATWDGDAWDIEDPEVALEVSAASEGAWGNSISYGVGSIEGAPVGVFAFIVYENEVAVESFEVSRNQDAKNGFGANIFIDEVVKRSRYLRVKDNPTVVGDYNISGTISLSGGTDDTIAPTAGAIMSAWDEFENVEDVPAQLLINAGWAVASVQQKMLSVAQNRKDAIAILDVPEDLSKDVSDMVDYRKNDLAANSYFGGLYGGWIKIYDQYNDREVDIPPSGDVAAVFANIASNGDRWEAAAGLQRGVIPNALGVSKVLTEGERDMLYAAGVNPVTTYGGAAAVIWGQKSLQVSASALDRLNVVFSVLWINQRVAQSLQPFVFEPNTVQVRDNVNFLVSSFLENLEQRGGLYGFFVDTSENINTPFVIDNNQLIINYFIKPVRTAEFIQASAIITPTGVQLG